MSETANTLIKAALRSIGAIATGETPTDDEMQEALESMGFMLENWSSKNIRLFYTKSETLTTGGGYSYTIGSGGDVDTTWPSEIRGARTSEGIVKLIDEAFYRQLRASDISGAPVEYLWYNPEYPLGKLYPWPLTSDTIYLDTLIPLTDPTALTTSMVFPPPYNDAVKWNLAVRLCPEYGREAPQTVATLAVSSLNAIETRNFANQINAARLEMISIGKRYNVEAG